MAWGTLQRDRLTEIVSSLPWAGLPSGDIAELADLLTALPTWGHAATGLFVPQTHTPLVLKSLRRYRDGDALESRGEHLELTMLLALWDGRHA